MDSQQLFLSAQPIEEWASAHEWDSATTEHVKGQCGIRYLSDVSVLDHGDLVLNPAAGITLGILGKLKPTWKYFNEPRRGVDDVPDSQQTESTWVDEEDESKSAYSRATTATRAETWTNRVQGM